LRPCIKAKFRKATALHRLGRSDGARDVAMSALHGAPTEEMEKEVKALLKTFDTKWEPAPAQGDEEDALAEGVEVMGRGLLASMAGGDQGLTLVRFSV